MKRISKLLASVATVGALLTAAPSARAYVEVPLPLGKIVVDSTNIVLMKGEKVGKARNLVI